jgi:acyl-CoA thioesterase-1
MCPEIGGNHVKNYLEMAYRALRHIEKFVWHRLNGVSAGFRIGCQGRAVLQPVLGKLDISRYMQKGLSGWRQTYGQCLVVPLLLALSACGGGGGGSSPGPIAQVPTPVKSISIGANGDSLTAGVEWSGNTAIMTPNTTPANLQKLLQANLGSVVTVVNHGVSAATLSNALSGTGGYKTPWKDALASNTEQIEIARWAVNDSNPAANESPTEFENYLISWIQVTQAAGKTVVLEEPNPVCNVAFATLPQYVAVIDKVAAQIALPLIKQYDYILSLPNWQSYFGPDCTHPSGDQLYQIMAQREAQVLTPIVATLQK